jgi:intraflagellar transport protein 122
MTAKNGLVLVEKPLAYYPLSMHSVNNPFLKTSYVVVSGSNKHVQILSREGVKLATITSKPADSWLWAADSYADDDTMVIGSHSGNVEYIKLNFNSVHSLYKDRYAYRENLTEVIVHHLVTDKKVRIKCKDMIHNLSLYRNKLAVQLLDRICVYESSSDDSVDIHFRLRKERVMLATISPANLESKIVTNLMVATSNHIVVASDNILELYSMEGYRQKIWKLESKINCMKVDGGPEGREGVVMGLASGSILKLYIDNPFPIELTKRSKGVVKLDVNVYRTMLVVIDAENTMTVLDLSTQETLFNIQGVVASSFNNEVEDLLCFTNQNNLISVVSGLVPLAQAVKRNSSSGLGGGNRFMPEIQELHLSGTALGFRGQKIFSLNKSGLAGIDVPQGANMTKALENADFDTAYKVACLGATEAEWRLLAMKSLRSNRLQIAKNAFSRLKDTKYLSLVEQIERNIVASNASTSTSALSSNQNDGAVLATTKSGRQRVVANAPAPQNPQPIATQTAHTITPLEARWLAEIMAFEGHYHEAAKIFTRSGRLDDAIQMFTLLRKWEDAKTFARNSGTHDIASLTAQQARWLQEIRDWKGAAELYISMGQYAAAARIIGENAADSASSSSGSHANTKGWPQVMMEVVRASSADVDKDTLIYCGEKLAKLDDVSLAKEAYTKAGDYGKLMTLYVTRKMWVEAAKLADEYQGKFDMSVFLSYAEWLVSQDRYEEAMEAFKKCGRIDLSRKVLRELTENAVNEKRFKDAGYYFWLLAKEIEQEITQIGNSTSNSPAESKEKEGKQEDLSMQQSEFEHKADLYHAYSTIHSFVTDPFTSFQPETLFQVSRFIINSLGIAEDSIPSGISKTATLYTLAKQAMGLGAYKLARNAFDRLARLRLPEGRQEEIELDALLVQAKPVRDNADHLPVCYRCGSTNPLLNPFTNRFAKGDVCTNCGHPFVRSFINFDILPLVEFVPEPAITDEEAIDLIRQPPSRTTRLVETKGGKWREEVDSNNGANILSFGGNDSMIGADTSMYTDQDGADLFTQCLNLTLEKQVSHDAAAVSLSLL